MKFLLVGFQKCGNTWARFVIFNYFNILQNNADKTLTYQDLTDINESLWDGKKISFPKVYFMHLPKNSKTVFGFNNSQKVKIYDKVDKMIYVTRNPFDCMISYFYYMTNRDLPFNRRFPEEELKELLTLKGFTKRFLPLYINHIKTTKPLANIVLNYDYLKQEPFIFKLALDLITNNKTNLNVLYKALEMSSFENIKQMGINTGQQYGLASSYRGNFCRDGRSGQYKEVMNEELIEYIKNECIKEGVVIYGI